MFGRDWEPATAKIVAKKYHESDDVSGTWEYVADITPRSGSPFRTTLKQPPFMSHVVRLNEGDTVPVLADVEHQKAKFDRSDPKISGKSTPSAKDVFDEALEQPPGSPPPADAAV
ncbi:MAG TPA: hypothetical protein VNR66_00885 [Solirubrobacteraceae bacterium]|nr:hypothetical protein [Solirubrobacteraceae bacterium]